MVTRAFAWMTVVLASAGFSAADEPIDSKEPARKPAEAAPAEPKPPGESDTEKAKKPATPEEDAAAKKESEATADAIEDEETANDSPEEKSIRAVIREVETAFNAHDAERLVALFSEHAEVVDGGGEVSRGRDEIRQIFKDAFEESPEVSINIDVESIRLLGPTVAIEEGLTRVVRVPGEPEELARYTVLYTKEGDAWKMISARDTPIEAAVSNQLDQLDWLIGDWLDESDDAVVTTTYRWADNGQFLVGAFEAVTPDEGTIDGTIQIGWDPQVRQIRSWVFDSEGGYCTGLWAKNNDTWIVKCSGVLIDGQTTTSTHRYTRLSSDHALFQSTDRVIGGVLIDDGAVIPIVRSAPAPEAVGQVEPEKPAP